jgi:hypothetical protein
MSKKRRKNKRRANKVERTDQPEVDPSRRGFLKVIAGVAGVAAAGYLIGSRAQSSDEPVKLDAVAPIAAPIVKPEVTEEVILDNLNDDRTFYVVLQRHKGLNNKGRSVTTDRIASCQVEIFRYVQHLYHSKGLRLATFEGYEGYLPRSPATNNNIEVILNSTDQELKDLVKSKEFISAPFLVYALEKLEMGGWEDKSYKKHFHSKVLPEYVRAQKALKSSSGEASVEAKRKALQLMVAIEKQATIRSDHCYEKSLALSERLIREKGLPSRDIAAVIGYGHKKDFYQIAEKEKQRGSHPRIVLVTPKSCTP